MVLYMLHGHWEIRCAEQSCFEVALLQVLLLVATLVKERISNPAMGHDWFQAIPLYYL
jgi:hypothetical protein